MQQHGEPLRVAIAGTYPLDTSHIRGGVQAAFAYLVKGLAKVEGLETHLLTLRQIGWEGPECLQQHGVTIHLLPAYPRFERLRNYRNYQSSVNQKLAQIQPDLVHAQEASADAYVAIRSGYPTVVTAHGIRFEDRKYYSSWGQQMRMYFDSLVIERSVMHRTRHLITISRYVIEYFAGLLRRDLKSYTIPNAIDERYFHLADPCEKPVVLFAGRVIPRKRVLDLVLAFGKVIQQFPSAQLRIAGECSSEPAYVELIRRRIRQLSLNGHVHLLGPLSEKAVLGEFSHCSILALPSSQETAPMVIAQAMAAGKPVVATPVGGVAEMVGEAGERGYLVRVGDVDALAAAIGRMLASPSLCDRLGQAGKAFAWQNYHSDQVARRTFEVYQKVVAMERGRNA